MVDERIGPYRVIQGLGAGGMGEVVLAHDERLDRLVAIKRLHHDHAATPERRERFRREARIVARLDHPAIVQIHDVLHLGDHDYLIMEYVDGKTLRARRDAGAMTVSEVLAIAHQIALGMAAAHALGVVHRDLKSENVLVTRAGRVKITDFGIAKLHGEDTVTAEGAVIGTFRAMSPEQALGRAVDHRSDLFSFGILLYEALSGESPFRAETPFLTVQRLVTDDPRPIGELVPAIPAGLERLIHHLLAKEPVLRPRDFNEVAASLIELAGQACDTPCHTMAAGPPVSAHDSRPTDDTEPPLRGLAASAPAASAPAASTRGSDHARELERSALLATAPRARATTRVRSLARPRYAAIGGAIIVALGVALGIGHAVLGRGAATRGALVRVAVLTPGTSDAGAPPDVTLLAVAVRNAVVAGVRARTGLDAVPWGDIESYVEGVVRDTGRRPEQRAVRTAVGADEVLAIDIACLPGSCRVTLERNTGAPGGPSPESFQLAADAAARPGDTVSAHLSRLYPEHPVRDAAAGSSIDPSVHERYAQLVQEYWAGHALPHDAMIAALESIRARSPRSIDVLLFEAEVLRHRYLQTEDEAQAMRARKLLEDADRLAPDTYDILSARFDIALSSRRFDEASALLDRLATLDPDSSATHLQRAKLHDARGELAPARAELDAAARRDAFSWRVLYHRAEVSRKLGDRAAVRAAIDELLRRSPGNYAGLSLRARDERRAGRLACAEQIYARLVEREPLYHECVNLGYTRSQLREYRQAVSSFRCALAIRPDDPAARLDLAESLLLAGDDDDAIAELRAVHQIVARKRRDAPDGALAAPDDLVEAQTLAYLGRRDPAMAAEARARAAQLLMRNPTRAGALHTAALVHAVLGDRDLAARDVAAYLDRGESATNFGLPWFDELRRDPALAPRLAVPIIAQTCDDGAAP